MARPRVTVNPMQGIRIRKVLQEQSLTQKDLADFVGVTPASISRYVNCEDRLNEDVARVISERYGYTTAWLRGESAPKTVYESQINELSEEHFQNTTILLLLIEAMENEGYSINQTIRDDLFFTDEQWNSMSPYRQMPYSIFHIIKDGREVYNLSFDSLSKLKRFLVRQAGVWIAGLLEEGDAEDGEY